jgi:hypothetical protein
MKRKETDRSQSIRQQSFAYIKDRIEREEWKNLQVFPINSEESASVFEKLYHADSCPNV